MKILRIILTVFLLIFCLGSSKYRNNSENFVHTNLDDRLIVVNNDKQLSYSYLPYDGSFIIDIISNCIKLKSNINTFKYIDKSINFDNETDILIKKCINFDTKENIVNQFSIINNLYDRLYRYNRKKISEEVTVINFDNYYSVVYDNDTNSCQNALDRGYLCNFLGIWLHHNWSSFMRLFNSLKVGSIAIIDGTKYKVKRRLSGIAYEYSGYFFSDGTSVPLYTNKYMITCSRFDYGSIWGITIIQFE